MAVQIEIERRRRLTEERRAAEEAERLAEQEHGAAVDHDAEKAKCADGLDGLLYWFDTWVWTFNPRLLGKPGGSYVRMVLWKRQRELVTWFYNSIVNQEEGAVDKSRDIGFTYIAVGVCLWFWLYHPGFKATFGSADADLVDSRDDPDSIFEKLRIIARRLPAWMLPASFNWRIHDNLNRFANPDNGSMISGEAGDEMGRGGRSTIFIVDEAAFIARAHRVERAVSGNTDCTIWASTSNGPGTHFFRKKHRLALGRVFRFHYSDDPRKSPEWVATKRASMDPIAWASEYEIDDTASVEGVCIPAKWVESAKKIKHLVRVLPDLEGVAGLDVGGGKAKSVFVARFGAVVGDIVSWGDPDTIETANRGLDAAEAATAPDNNGKPSRIVRLLFDNIGIGQGVVSALIHAKRPGMRTFGINVGDRPSETRWADGKTSREKFVNLKADCWFLARQRFKNTHEMVLWLENPAQEGAVEHPLEDLISLPDDSLSTDAQALNFQLSLPKWFRNEAGKTIIESKIDLSRRGIPSPDHAEAFILTFADPGPGSLLISDAVLRRSANPGFAPSAQTPGQSGGGLFGGMTISDKLLERSRG